MITSRDIRVAAATFCITSILAFTVAKPDTMSSSVFDWNELKVRETKTGAVRSVFRSATPTLEELECHITTLKPGEAAHAPHQHPEEEILIIKEGLVESLVNGSYKKLGPGSVIFQASNQVHTIRNAGEIPATYHVFSWRSAATPRK